MQSRISDVIITLDKKYEDRMNDAVNDLKKAGVQIDETDDDNSIVEGTVEVDGVMYDQLFINPDDCIDCNLCEPECPVDAIEPRERGSQEIMAHAALLGGPRAERIIGEGERLIERVAVDVQACRVAAG